MYSFMKYIKVAAQYESDSDNFRKLGVPNKNIITTGSIKFDINVKSSVLDMQRVINLIFLKLEKILYGLQLARMMEKKKKILFAHRQLLERIPNLLLILAPRHPERSSHVSGLLKQEGFNYQKESDSSMLKEETEVLLIDSIGKLMEFYGASDLSFVGGSLVNKGGHNPIEPAFWGLPIISGPNFFLISRIFVRN